MNATFRAACRLLLALACGAIAGCASHSGTHEPASRLTEAQRDSAIARSEIPGAAAVGRAFQVAGREARHSAQMDSLSSQ